ncbi:MAG: hypothetical protein KAS21_01585 [Candidatus Aminicenantes bacterium]|nr:hypothetical protein [Candidatus Aminicenantes bacterium]
MKIQVWDSFNFSETTSLFNELLKDIPLSKNTTGKGEEFITQKVFKDNGEFEQDKKILIDKSDTGHSEFTDKGFSTIETSYKEPPPQLEDEGANLLERSLSGMCKRGGFHGAVIADLDGLPVAVFNSPVNEDILAAYTTILGESLEKAASFLNQPDANNISIDINILDKIVLRKFTPDKTSYYLMVISPQNIDGRAEVELVINQISQILQ